MLIEILLLSAVAWASVVWVQVLRWESEIRFDTLVQESKSSLVDDSCDLIVDCPCPVCREVGEVGYAY